MVLQAGGRSAALVVLDLITTPRELVEEFVQTLIHGLCQQVLDLAEVLRDGGAQLLLVCGGQSPARRTRGGRGLGLSL